MNSPNEKVCAMAPSNFKAQVLDSSQPVLVAFMTGWSHACKALESVLEEVARDLTGKIQVVKVNADDSLDLSLWYEIQSVPTMVCFVGGEARVRIVGTASKDAIIASLKPFTP